MFDLIELESMPKETLIKMLKVYSNNWLTMDGFWFRNIEDEYGTEIATRFDEKMWEKYAEVEGRRIKEALNITEDGFDALFKVMNFAIWAISEGFDYEFEEMTERRVVFYNTGCRNQEARLKQGLDEFPCKKVGINCWTGLAKAINHRIKVDSIFCPPDSHPEGIFCKWSLTLTE